ncbi:protein Simiate isoform X2 [Exaiptasia diaphana]|nr:protein Simiate isoform X2 [Exaiptasia diaphana]KXJ21972.1 Protein Simiate [Exaiptasia diaphana]
MACDSERQSFIDRYFTRGYVVDNNGNSGEDQCVLLHSNKLCVITIAPEHPIVKQGSKVSDINFQVSSKLNRLDSKAVGKSKKGAQWIMPDAPLCEVTCSDGKKYILNCCMKGKLIEINDELISKPELLNEKPETEGYVAVILPKLQEVSLYFDKLLTTQQYEEILEKRKSSLKGTTDESQKNL